MSYSKLTYLGDGDNITFVINFTLGFLSREDVQCRVGEEVDGFDQPVYRTITWINDGLVTISGDPPGVDVEVVFTRTVSKIEMQHDYQDGAPLTELNLDESGLQLMMALHEILDGRVDAAPVIDPEGSVTLDQLNTAIADLQAQIDALEASQASAIADAIAALEAEIDESIAEALADVDLNSGDRLIDHAYDEYTATTVLNTLMPYTSEPEITDGTEILSCTIETPAVGNKILCKAQASGHPNASSTSGMAMFINGVWVRSSYGRSANNTPSFPAALEIVYEFEADSTDPIEVTVRAGYIISGSGAAFNDTFMGGGGATLTVDEIGVGDFTSIDNTVHLSGTPWELDVLIADPDNFNQYIYTFSQAVILDSPAPTGTAESETAASAGGAQVWIAMADPSGGTPDAGTAGFGLVFSPLDTTGVVSNHAVNTPGIPLFGSLPDASLSPMSFAAGDKLVFKVRAADIPSGLTNVQLHLEGTYI